jgi:hypothetical protein
VGYPRWLGSAREERQQCCRGAAEGTGKEVRSAPGVGAELGAVTESLEWDRVAFCGSSMAATLWHSGGNRRRRKKGALHRGGGCSF